MSSPIEDCLEYALNARASELIIVEGLSPAVRLNDKVCMIQDAPVIPFGSLDSFVKSLDGESGVLCGGPWCGANWRVRYSREAFGKLASFRPMMPECPHFSELGVPDVMMNLLGVSSGLVLFAGPPCSGKTTTASSYVAAMCQNRMLRGVFLDSVEEFNIPTGDSLVIKSKSKDITKELKQGLLAGTDLFWLGDIDDEHIIPALRAAEAGAIVVGCFNAGNSVGALDAMVCFESSKEMKIAKSLLASNLKALVIQHLIPSVDNSQMVSAWELIYNNQNISNLIRNGEHFKLPPIVAASTTEGMVSMDHSLLALLQAGVISKKDALKYAFDPSKIG
ncbi:MAG TPA: ATPase, T2SS/T4P/T4SS family [Fibrobacteraceae bacterium]|jgi:twitching motility protein PilT|nr:ATPase, T2SS/T4P/T4SS family [Fibrobacteraceae bacterium]